MSYFRAGLQKTCTLFFSCAIVVFFSSCASVNMKLISGENDIRQNALMSLDTLRYKKSEKVLEFLLHTLEKSPYWEVRARAAEALGYFHDYRTMDALVNALRDEDKDVRKMSAQSLGNMRNKRVLDPLITAVSDPEAVVRKNAIIALGSIADPLAIPTIATAVHDQDPGVRKEAIRSLMNIGKPAMETLIGFLSDADWELKWSIEGALTAMGQPATEYLIAQWETAEWYIKWRTAKILLLTESSQRAAHNLNTLGNYATIKQKALEYARIENMPRFHEFLIKQLSHSDWNIRLRAVEYAGYTGNKAAIEKLKELLHDNIIFIREEAATALEELGWTPATIEEKVYYYSAKKDWENLRLIGGIALHLFNEMLTNGNEGIKIRAAESLGELKYRIAAKPLLEHISDGNPHVRIAILNAMGKLVDIDLTDEYTRVFNDSDKNIAILAIQAVGKKKSTRAIRPLVKMLYNKDADIRRETIDALKIIGGPVFGPVSCKLYDSNKAVVNASVEILKTIQTLEAKEKLERFLNEQRSLAEKQRKKQEQKDLNNLNKRIPEDLNRKAIPAMPNDQEKIDAGEKESAPQKMEGTPDLPAQGSQSAIESPPQTERIKESIKNAETEVKDVKTKVTEKKKKKSDKKSAINKKKNTKKPVKEKVKKTKTPKVTQ